MNKKRSKVTVLVAILCVVSLLAGCAKSKVPKRYDYDLSKYITLGQYEGVTYDPVPHEVTDEDIDNEIYDRIYYYIETEEIKEGKVEADSFVNIDYAGKLVGETEPRDTMTAEDQDIDIADSGMIPGFAEAIIGHEVGETFDIHVTFPEDYNEELGGKEAVFTITVNYLTKENLPELTDEFIKENYGYDTLDDFKAAIREELAETKEQDAISQEQEQVFSKILESSEVIEYPEKELEEKKNQMKETYQEYAEMYGMDYGDFLEMFIGYTEEQFDEEITAYAENTVKQELVLYSLAKALGIKVSNKEYSDFLDGLLEDAGLDREVFEEEYGMTIDEYAEDYNLYESYLYELIMDKVMEKSVANE
ncbi:MAG: trigger factor [Mogibacterium sp.]|nr:trigger factor [Mogibacterium sp.]